MKQHKIYTPNQLVELWNCTNFKIQDNLSSLTSICIDTRHIPLPDHALFFALKGSNSHGNIYIHDAIQKGIKNIVTDDISFVQEYPVNYFIVDDTIDALQQLAKYHRDQYSHLPIIGITGSHGKTIIKEWLSQLQAHKPIAKSPKSYNSQIGVALSLWEISDEDQLGIFEAGISQMGEMEKLEDMMSPNIGIFTTLGDAHDSGFDNSKQKLIEKIKLFKKSDIIIFEEDNAFISKTIRSIYPNKILKSWGFNTQSTLLKIHKIIKKDIQSEMEIEVYGELKKITVPFNDDASLHNLLTCITSLLALGEEWDAFINSIQELKNLPMRLEMKNGLNGSLLINDTYNADLHSFRIALEFLSQQAGVRDKVVIISDFLQLGIDAELLAQKIAYLVDLHGISTLLGIGENMAILEKHLSPFILFHREENTESLIKYLDNWHYKNKAILIKGARKFNLEKVFERLSDRSHTTSLEIDLKAVENNLKVFKETLDPQTGIIAVIKASAYGTGSEDLALLLQNKKVSYLAVAFADEAVKLRKAGITQPIIILNPESNSLQDMIKYDLEPEIYSLNQLNTILAYIKNYNFKIKIHLKIDTGMHRLGFESHDFHALTQLLKSEEEHLEVKSIFSHLTSAENDEHDEWTHYQAQNFLEAFTIITSQLNYPVKKHILNSAGILRFPEYQWDYVRLGLGLYGLSSITSFPGLERVHTLTAYIMQIKHLDVHQTVGYNKKGITNKQTNIAVINIGYADGLMRIAGMGRFFVSIHGTSYPIIGQICMDLTMIDIGQDIDKIHVGDPVIIFGKDKPIEDLAQACQTIPYEILSRISERIKRIYTRS